MPDRFVCKRRNHLGHRPYRAAIVSARVLVAVNAFFAAAEIAVISLNENILHREAEEGNKKAEKMLQMVRKPAKFLSTIQIGITLAGFLASAFAANSFAERLTNWAVNVLGVTAVAPAFIRNISVILITLILSYFTLVFGELVPKRVAMQKAEKVARATSGVIFAVYNVFRPLIWLLSASTNGVLRLLHIDTDEETGPASEDEIRLMVDISEEKGAIEANEKTMIENVFEFNNTSAEDVMVHRTDMAAIWIDDTAEEIIHTIEETGLSRFPVYEDDVDDIIGILSTREYLLNARLPDPKPLREILRPAYFVPETVHIDALFRDMQSKKIHMAVVVDEYGGTSGIVTMEDLLEEIVGEIYDEFDPLAAQDIVQLEPNLWRVAGSAELDALREALDMEFPEDEEFDTLGGMVFSQLTAIPEDGSHPEVDACGLHIKVEELSERRVEWALVSKLDPKTPGAAGD